MSESVIRELVVKFKGDESGLERAMEATLGKVKSFAAEVVEAGGVLGAAFAGGVLAVGALAGAALEAGQNVNAAWREIEVKTGEVGAGLEGLKADFAAVFAGVPESATGVANAIAQIRQRTGESGEALQELTTKEIELAHITGAQLAPQIEATTKLFQNWKGSIQAPGEALQFLFTLSQKTGISVTQLASEMNTAGPVMRQLGVSFEQGAAMLAQLDKEGIDSAKVLAGMSVSFKKIVRDGKDPIEFFGELIQKMKDASTAAEANKLAIEFFGKGAATMGEAVRAGRLDVEALLDSMKGGGPTIEDTAAKVRTIGEAFELFRNKIELLLAPLGQGLIDALKSAVSGLDSMIEAYKNNFGGLRTAVADFTSAINDIWSRHGEKMKSITAEAWGNIVDQIRDNVHRISEVLKAGAALIEGNWSDLWKHMVEIVVSFAVSIGDIMYNLAEHVIPGWLVNASRHVRDFVASSIRSLAGIEGTIDIKMPGVPGLPSADILAQEEAFLKAGERSGGGYGKGLKKGLKEGVDEAFKLVQDWMIATGQTLKLSESVWKTLSDSTKAAFVSVANEYHANEDRSEKWGATLFGIFSKLGMDVGRVGDQIVIHANKIDKTFADLQDHISEHIIVQNAVLNTAIAPVNLLAVAATDMADKIRSALSSNDFVNYAKATVAATNDTKAQIDSLIATFTALGKQAGLTGAALVEFVRGNVRQAMGDLSSEADKALGDFQASVEKINFDALSKKINSTVSAITETLTLIPGEFGKMAKGIDSAVRTIDKILGNLHKIFSDIPADLGGIIAKIIGLFQSVQAPVAGASKTISGSLDQIQKSAKAAAQGGSSSATTVSTSWIKAGDGLKVGLSAAAGAFASLTTAMAVTSATGSKTAGIVSSLFTSTLAGIQAGMAFGPVGGAIVGGISLIGGIIGSLMGKSPLQKAQEAAALQKAKDDIKKSQEEVLQMVEKTKQSWIDTLDKSRQLLESITFYTSVPKVSFQAFFKDVGKLFSNVVDLAKKWKLDATKDIAEAADNLKSGAELISALPAALDAISKYLGTPEVSFQTFFAAATKFFDFLINWISEIPKRIQRQIGAFGERVKAGVDLLGPLMEALNAMFTLKELPSEEQFNLIDRAIDMIVQHVGDLATKFDKFYLKQLEFFATKALAGLQVWKEATDAIRATVDVPTVTEADADRVVGNLRMFLDRLISSLTTMATEDLVRVAAIAGNIVPIANALKAWSDAAAAIRGYTEVAAEIWDKIKADFERGLSLIHDLTLDAQKYLDEAITFEDVINKASAHIEAGLAKYVSTITAMSTTLTASLGTPLPPGGGGFGALSLPSLGAMGVGGLAGGFGAALPALAPQHHEFNLTLIQPPPTEGDLSTYERFKGYTREFWREIRGRAQMMGIGLPVYLTDF
jgi:phage-related minor tail protein